MNTLLITLCLLVPTHPQASPDANRMAGVWKPIHFELGGSPWEKSKFANMTLTVKGETYEFLEGPSLDAGNLVFVPKSSPKQMDIKGIKGPNAGRTIPAIYRFKHDHLTVCYGLKGIRPTEFRSPKGSMVLLVEFTKSPKLKL